MAKAAPVRLARYQQEADRALPVGWYLLGQRALLGGRAIEPLAEEPLTEGPLTEGLQAVGRVKPGPLLVQAARVQAAASQQLGLPAQGWPQRWPKVLAYCLSSMQPGSNPSLRHERCLARAKCAEHP